PAAAPVNHQTVVTVAALVEGAGLQPSTVKLERYNLQAARSGFSVALYDDGTHGDAAPNDRIFTGQFSVNEAAPTPFFFKIVATFAGAPSALVSELGVVVIQGAATADQTLADLSNELRAGRVDLAGQRFSDAARDQQALARLDRATQGKLADAIAKAQLI